MAESPSPQPSNGDVSPIHAVIVAAVAAVLEQEFRITSLATTEIQIDPRWSAWSTEGRRDVFTSHRFR